VLGLAARSGSLLAVGALGALYLRESTRRGTNRYEGLPVKRLRAAAERVRTLSQAELVIFGHTHVPESLPGYLNPGSFQYRSGARPYAYVDESGRAERRTLD
jgi:predicted phosphodiesterase